MSYFAKQRMIYYKRFKLDIWGILKNTLQWKIDRSNYFSKFLKRKLGKIYRSINFYKNESKNKRKHLNFLIGYKYVESKGLKILIDASTNLKFIKYINLSNKFKLRRGKRPWYIKKLKYNEARMAIFKFNGIIYKYYIKLIYLKYLFVKFLKTTITKKTEKSFSYFFTKKPRREKVYYRTPFIYEMRFFPIKVKKYKTKPDFLTLRVTKLFYVIYNYKQLKTLCRKAKRKDGMFEQNYLLLMECKIPSFMYRSSFIPNMFESIDFVKASNVWINKYFISYIYYVIKPKDIVGFRILTKGFIFWSFYKRIRRRAFIFLFPKYIYISIIFFLIVFLKAPTLKDIINPISVDMYRLYNYAI